MKFLLAVLLLVAAAAAETPVINQFMRPSGVERFRNVIKAFEYAKTFDNAKDSKIVGGIEAVPNSRPYQVGLFLTLPQGTAFCGGSLISDQFVLTAAHCKYDGSNNVSSYTVVLGSHNIYDEKEGVRVQTSDAILHPSWSPSTLQNDICILRLPVKVQLSQTIQTVLLPPKSAVSELFVDALATVSGWGKPTDSATAISQVLRQVTVPVITNSRCNTWYLGSIRDTHICTDGSGGKSSCNGDSGGPLTASYNNQTVQVGVVSFGIVLGCEVGWPAAFTRTTSYLDWISNTTGIALRP